MVRPNEDVTFNWGNLWADLLKGAGRGLLEYDGSRAAQAALAGLDVFDAAQERRRRSDQPEPSEGTYQGILMNLWPAMTPAERAAFLRLPPEQRGAWVEEWTQGSSDSAPRIDDGSPAIGGVQPRSWRSRCRMQAGLSPSAHSTAGTCNPPCRSARMTG